MNLKDHTVPVLEYIGLLAAGAVALKPEPLKVCLGGLGSCALFHCLSCHWSGRTRIFSVESDSRILELAKRFFRLPPRSKVIIGDFREKLMGATFNRCDLIMVDCYSSTSIPPHLATVEFMALAREKLAPRGVAAFNIWNPDCNLVCGCQVRAIIEAFGEAAVAACREDANIVVFARKTPGLPWPKSLRYKGFEYPLAVYGAENASAWPDYVTDSEPIDDDNVWRVFSGAGRLV